MLWPALQKSMSSLQTPAHQLRNQSAKSQWLPEEQPRAFSHNTKFKQRLQHLSPQQNVSASNCGSYHSGLLPQMPGRRRNGISLVCVKYPSWTAQDFPCSVSLSFVKCPQSPWPGHRRAFSAQNAFTCLLRTFSTCFLILECEKNPPGSGGHSEGRSLIATHDWRKREFL